MFCPVVLVSTGTTVGFGLNCHCILGHLLVVFDKEKAGVPSDPLWVRVGARDKSTLLWFNQLVPLLLLS